MDFPFEWQPRIVSTQLALIGPVAVACVPGEFTTMSGRRLRDAVTLGMAAVGGPLPSHVIVAGLCNTYSDYITTPEEYEVRASRRFTAANTQACRSRNENDSVSLNCRPWVGKLLGILVLFPKLGIVAWKQTSHQSLSSVRFFIRGC
jgi:hypothetical protein